MKIESAGRSELTHLLGQLLTRYDATTDAETCAQVGSLVVICRVLLDDQAPLTAAELEECRHGLLEDAAAIGVHLVH